jgi:hypothetical protein
VCWATVTTPWNRVTYI